MKKLMILFLASVVMINCSDSGTEPESSNPSLSFSPEAATLTRGGQVQISLNLSNIETNIFGISLQIEYESAVASFDENNGFTAGDFFNQDAIQFVKESANKIYLTMSMIQGNAPVNGNGILGILTFAGVAAGQFDLEIDESALNFYDESGGSIAVSGLTLLSSQVTVE